jgi:hypothetical protein
MYEDAGSAVRRLSDGAYIPKDERNYDYRQVLAWVDAGNTLLPSAQDGWRLGVWGDFRARREMYLDRLAGIAVFEGENDAAIRCACRAFRQRLLDLPAHESVRDGVTPTKADLEQAIVVLYFAARDEAMQLAPAAYAAFNKIAK